MADPKYKPAGGSTASPTAMTQRKEILVPRVLTDYTLLYHYGDLDRTPVRNATFLATLSDGEIRKGCLDDKGQAQLCGVAKGPVSVEYQYDAPDTDDASIVAARDKIRQALDAIVAQTKLDMADEWKEWKEAGWLEREYLKTINTAQGGAVGAWHWLSGTAETVWQLGVLIYKLDKEKREINRLFITGQWAELDKKIASYRSKGREVLAEASEIKELLNLIFHDEKTRALITTFASQWWAAIPPDEQRELAASGGMQIIIDVAIGVLLASFTAGAGGAAYGSAKWAAAGGRLGARVKKLLDTLKDAFEGLAKALRVRKRKVVDLRRKADGARTIVTKWKRGEPKAVGGGVGAVLRRVQTDKDSAFFWSGRTNGVGGDKQAAKIAAKHGGKTWDMLIEERDIKMPPWDTANPTSIKAWEDISAEYANGASGEVRAVIGDKLRPGNIWETKELPRLRANSAVTKITAIDPLTEVETVVFTR